MIRFVCAKCGRASDGGQGCNRCAGREPNSLSVGKGRGGVSACSSVNPLSEVGISASADAPRLRGRPTKPKAKATTGVKARPPVSPSLY